MVDVPTITLNNGVAIPQVGFGTYQVPAEQTADVVLEAFDIGYRHIDTAQMYGNEAGVGEAVRSSGLGRTDVFVVSKLDNGRHARDDARRAIEGSLEATGLDYLDLFLIHWPQPVRDVYVEAWHVLEEFYRDGILRAIGVSNFTQAHVTRLVEQSDVVPAVNQIEIHPYFAQEEQRAFDAELSIANEAWSPIARGRVLGNPVVVDIATRVARTPAQVTLRWAVQRGDIVIPKSTHRARMAENLDLFDFSLTDADMAAITALDCGDRHGPHPDDFN